MKVHVEMDFFLQGGIFKGISLQFLQYFIHISFQHQAFYFRVHTFRSYCSTVSSKVKKPFLAQRTGQQPQRCEHAGVIPRSVW
jgi:hypothetical protein